MNFSRFWSWEVFVATPLLLSVACSSHTATTATSRHHALEISNDSEGAISVDWIHPSTGKTRAFANMRQGETIKVNSFANHTFLVRYNNDTTCTTTYDSDHQVCRSTVIVVSDNDDQAVKIKQGLELEHSDTTTTTAKSHVEKTEIVENCKRVAQQQLRAGYRAALVTKQMQNCVESALADKYQTLHEEKMFERTLRESISSKVEDYTCADKTLETTKAQEIRQWTDHNASTTIRPVHVLHERQASKIHLIENFISKEECAAIQEAAEPLLHRGTVADGKGGSKLSDHRKAMQAGIRIPWELEEKGNPITRVFRRIYAYTNDATGFGISVEGQEDLMSIQYFGRKEGESPDRYKPHCDGDCNGLPHKRGGRVATMVMYCDTEGLDGGATNFGHAGVYVKPKIGAAAFFSYLDPDTHIHETGFTTHSGCPVEKGVKRIAVHWMRIGVTEDMPWDSFNTNNVHKSECDDE